MDEKNIFQKAFVATIPVLLGYTAIGLAYGLLVVHTGFPWFFAPVMSIIIYAGAMQYLALGLFASGTGFLQMALITLFVNSRHSIYGLSLLNTYRNTGRKKPYLIYALTDETYALLTSAEVPSGTGGPAFCFYVSILNQSYWVTASAAGAILGNFLPINTQGLDFALPALFVVLAVEQIKNIRSRLPVFIAAVSGFLAYFFIGPGNMLVFALLFAIGGLILFRRRLPSDGP